MGSSLLAGWSWDSHEATLTVVGRGAGCTRLQGPLAATGTASGRKPQVRTAWASSRAAVSRHPLKRSMRERDQHGSFVT